MELVPDRDDGFNLKTGHDLSLRFVTDTQGKVVELALNYPDEGSFGQAEAVRHVPSSRQIPGRAIKTHGADRRAPEAAVHARPAVSNRVGSHHSQFTRRPSESVGH